MRKIHITVLILLTTVTLGGLNSCSKKIDDSYRNPNADVKVPVEQILPNAIATMAGNGAGHGTLNDFRFIGKYIQNFAFASSGGQYDKMGGTTGVSDNAASIWRTHYYDLGQNLVKMVLWAEEEQKWNYVGVGKAIQAWSWLSLTDMHGDVILKEAFNTSQLTFKYDSQADVYAYVRQLCYEAIANLNRTDGASTAANLAIGDQYFYGGDVNKWKKFVYGVLARSYNHLSNKSSYSADSVIKYCDLSITNIAEDAMVKYAATSVSGTNNYFGPLRGNLNSASIGTETGIRQASYSANLMNGSNPFFASLADPRAWYLLRGNVNGTIIGVDMNAGQSGITANDRPENFHGISQAASSTPNNSAPSNDLNCRYIFRNNSPTPIMTATEIAFMKAEALYKKGDKPAALASYLNGINFSFDMLTTTFGVNVPAANVITPAMKLAYINNAAVTPATAAGLTLSHIMLQKYIALWGYGCLETWTDMRRYHYTDSDAGQQVYRGFVVPTLFINNGTNMVYRVRPRYNSEYIWNINELNRIGAVALDYHTKPMWFMEP